MAKVKIKTKMAEKKESKNDKKPKKTPYKCKICSKSFSERQYLKVHKAIHAGQTFQCQLCEFTTATKKYLNHHKRQVHTGEKKHKCSYCAKLFLHPVDLREHEMIHTGEKPHVCKVCGKSFRVTYCLNTHMLIHKDEKPFKCSFCEYACRDSSTLRKHQNKHMGIESVYRCKICQKGYKAKWKLKNHVAEKHFDMDLKKVPCEQCGALFKSVSRKNQHISIVHSRKFTCKCPVCGFQLADSHNLTAHMRTHMDERPFSCTHEGCSWTFKAKGDLAKHMKIHDPSQHLPCSHCGRKFVRKAHLKRHEQVMHLERVKNVECDYCGARFYTKNYLLKHIQMKHVHKQRFKYICDICGLKTYNKPSIVMHLKYGHSNDNDMECKLCPNKVYKRHVYLKTHYWRTHHVKYKICRKPTRRVENIEEDCKPDVEIKVEPFESEPFDEIHLMEIDKEENEEDNDSLVYSKNVLSEDLTALVLKDGKIEGKEVEFDEFFIKHIIDKEEDKTETKASPGVDEIKDQLVQTKIKEILIRTEKAEKAKALRKQKKEEERVQREKEEEDARLKEETERQEIVELRRVRDWYNERMYAALERERQKKKTKDRVTIKYFKKNPGTNAESSTTNDKNDSYLEDDENDKDKHRDSLTNDDINDGIHDDDDMPLNTYADNTSSRNEANKNLTDEEKTVNNTEVDKTNINDDDEMMNKKEEVSNRLSLAIDDINLASEEVIMNDEINKKVEPNSVNTIVDENNLVQNSKTKADLTIDDELHEDHNYIQNMRDENHEKNDTHEKNSTHDHNYGENKNYDQNSENDALVTCDESNDLTVGDKSCNNDIGKSSNDTNVTSDKITEEAIEKQINNDITIDPNREKTHNNSERYGNDYNLTNSERNDREKNNDKLDQNIPQCSKSIVDTNKVITENNDSSNEVNDNDVDDSESNDSDYEKPLIYRQKRKRKSTRFKKLPKKMEFKTHQCYVCFKLYQTKEELINHCQEHFDICNVKTLAKCPICSHVTSKIAQHMLIKHKIKIKVPFNKIKDRNTTNGSRYCYDIEGTEIELIPSVKILNKTASIEIDKKRREENDKRIAKSKLVRKGDTWIVEKEFIDLKFDEIPELTDLELNKCKVTGNDVDRLGQISKLAKKKGLKIMFPCFKCDKVCQNFAALKLHKRRHEDNPKPFAPRIKDGQRSVKKDKVQLDKSNRTALPKPIKKKHKCDEKLQDFFERNIRGGDVEFWQFLKIFNKMDREKVKDFKDLEERSDFGNHLDYYKDDDVKADEINDGDSNDSEDERLAKEIDDFGAIDDETNDGSDDEIENIEEVEISDDNE